jgi:predicted tellurium resistance membrane protein TerC
MDYLFSAEIWASLLTLTVLEIVLGIDNLIFLGIIADRLPPAQQTVGRRVGLALALALRLALLGTISWITHLTAPVFGLGENAFSWRDLILIGGGLFLVQKGTVEIHARIEEEGESGPEAQIKSQLAPAIAQIAAMDLVFSLDSVITAVGMASELWVMMAAVCLAMIVMILAAAAVAAFVNRHPTVKMLALSFLLLIGMTLIADGFGMHVPKGYIYAAIGFSAAVEALNQVAARRRHRRQQPTIAVRPDV